MKRIYAMAPLLALAGCGPIDPAALKAVANNESGHVAFALAFPKNFRLDRVTVTGRGAHPGVTNYTFYEGGNRIQNAILEVGMRLAGPSGEETLGGTASPDGAGLDREEAAAIARNVDAALAQFILAEAGKLAREVVAERPAGLKRLAEEIVRRRSLNGPEAASAFLGLDRR